MRVSCEKCGSQYNVDDARIPMTGLRMQCTKCGYNFTVERAKGAGGGQGPAATKQAQYHVRRRSGRVFGPFLEGAILKMLKEQTLAGDEDVSLDAKTWTPLANVPAFAAHLGAQPPGEIDLPAPKTAPPPAPPGVPAPVPPAPTAARPGVPPAPTKPPPAAPSAPPKVAPGVPSAPPKAAPGVPSGRPPPTAARPAVAPPPELADLPAPKGARGASAPPPPQDDFADLPAPKRPLSPGLAASPGSAPGGGADVGFDDFTDLPVPKRNSDFDMPALKGGRSQPPGLTDLPAPKRDPGLDLPAPKRNSDFDMPALKGGRSQPPGLTDLPAPKPDPGLDLPAPKRDPGLDLPAPKGARSQPAGLADLPAPKRDPGLDLPAPKGARSQPAGLADLPAPKRDPGLDLPAPKGARPEPAGLADLPTPKRDPGLDLLTPKGERSGVDLLAPKRAQSGVDLPSISDMSDVLPPRLGGRSNLPAPKRPQNDGGVDLLAPRGHIEGPKPDLLAPKRSQGAIDLPVPKHDPGIDLLTPKEDALGLDLNAGALEFDELAGEPGRKPPTAPGPGEIQEHAEALDEFDLLPLTGHKPPTGTSGTPLRPSTGGKGKPLGSGTPVSAVPEGFGRSPGSAPKSLGFSRPLSGTGNKVVPPAGQPMLEMPGLELEQAGFNLDGSAPLDLAPPSSDFDSGLKISTTGAGQNPLEASGLSFKSPGSPPPAASPSPPSMPVLDSDALDAGLQLGRPVPRREAPPPEPVVATTPPPADTPQPRPERVRRPSRERRSIPRTPVYAALLLLVLGGGGFLFLKYRRDQKAAAAAERKRDLDKARRLMAGDTPERYKRAAQLAERVATESPADLSAKVLASEAFYMASVTAGGNVGTLNKGKSYLAGANAAPTSLDLKRARALKALLAGQLGTARSTLESAGKDGETMLFLGWTELIAGRGPQALEALRKALEVAPKRPDAQLAFAQARVMANDSNALDGLRELVKANPKDLRAETALVMAEPMSATARATRIRDVFGRYPGKAAPPFETVWVWTRIARQALGELNLNEADSALAEVAKIAVALPATKQAAGDLAFLREKYDEALPLYDQAVIMDGGVVEPLIARARLQIQVKQYTKAETDLDAAAKLDGKDPRVVYWKGRLAEAQRDVGTALKRYQEAIDLDVSYLEAYLRKAQLHRADRQNDEATETLGRAMAQARKDPRAMLALATAYLDGKEFGLAEDALRKAIAADPRQLEAHMRLGQVLERQDQLEEARRAYAAAYQALPGDQDAAVALVRTSLATGKVDEAREVFAAAMASPAVSPRMIAEAALMEFRADNYARVKELGEKLRAQAQENAVGLFAKGVDSYRQVVPNAGDATQRAENERLVNDAIQSFKNAMTIDSRAEFHFALGRALVDQKRYDEALQEFASAVRKDESYADARAGLARMFILKRRFAEALTEIERLIKQRADVAEYHKLAGDVALENNDPERAFTAYQEALRYSPKDGEAYFRLGQIYADREQGRDVVRALEKAVKLGDQRNDKWMPEAYRALGYALRDAGKRGKAIKAFKKVLEIAPEGTDAEDAERQLAILENR